MVPANLITTYKGGALVEAITTAIESLLSIVTLVVEAITDNAVLTLFLASGVVGIGVGIFRKLKRG